LLAQEKVPKEKGTRKLVGISNSNTLRFKTKTGAALPKEPFQVSLWMPQPSVLGNSGDAPHYLALRQTLAMILFYF
jgi:hypothetical protein